MPLLWRSELWNDFGRVKDVVSQNIQEWKNECGLRRFFCLGVGSMGLGTDSESLELVNEIHDAASFLP